MAFWDRGGKPTRTISLASQGKVGRKSIDRKLGRRGLTVTGCGFISVDAEVRLWEGQVRGALEQDKFQRPHTVFCISVSLYPTFFEVPGGVSPLWLQEGLVGLLSVPDSHRLHNGLPEK